MALFAAGYRARLKPRCKIRQNVLARLTSNQRAENVWMPGLPEPPIRQSGSWR